MTRRRSATGAHFGLDDGILPGRRPGARVTIAGLVDTASVRNGRYWHRRCPSNPRPSWLYLVIGGLSYPVLRLPLSRALAGGRTAARRRADTCSPPTTSRTPTPGRSGWRCSRAATCGSWPSPSSSGSRSGPFITRLRRLSGAARRARPGGDRHRGPPLPRGPRRRDVSRRARGARRACGSDTRHAGARARPASRSRPACRSSRPVSPARRS